MGKVAEAMNGKVFRKALREYPGQWVAIWDGEIIAHGETLKNVLTEAEVKGIEHPFVTHIPSDPEDILIATFFDT